jgi:hypothetical protein
MPQLWTVRHPVSPVPKWTKIPMPEQVRYRNKGTQSGSGMLWYPVSGLRYRIPECRCPAMPKSYKFHIHGVRDNSVNCFWIHAKVNFKTMRILKGHGNYTDFSFNFCIIRFCIGFIGQLLSLNFVGVWPDDCILHVRVFHGWRCRRRGPPTEAILQQGNGAQK